MQVFTGLLVSIQLLTRLSNLGVHRVVCKYPGTHKAK